MADKPTMGQRFNNLMSKGADKIVALDKKVVATKDAVVDKVVHAFDSSANVIVTPIMNMKVRAGIKKGVTEKADEAIDAKVAEATSINRNSDGAPVVLPIARELAVQNDMAPSDSQIRDWGRKAADAANSTIQKGAYKNQAELEKLLAKNIREEFKKIKQEGFILPQPEVDKMAQEVAKSVSANYDKFPSTVKREAARRTPEPVQATQQEAPMKTGAASKSSSNEVALGTLTPKIIGQGQGMGPRTV